jgi:5-methylcytosine-specific restriction endonuclease McrA
MTATRGTTNGNARGGSDARRRRREWLVETYRADVDAIDVRYIGGDQMVEDVALPACRCYRCGILLTVDTVTVDRIIPGCKGGTYRRDNIRPACGPCNSITGGSTRAGK